MTFKDHFSEHAQALHGLDTDVFFDNVKTCLAVFWRRGARRFIRSMSQSMPLSMPLWRDCTGRYLASNGRRRGAWLRTTIGTLAFYSRHAPGGMSS